MRRPVGQFLILICFAPIINLTFICIFKNQSLAVGSLCDNIEVDHTTGDLWLGCYPSAMKVAAYDVEDPPGSEVSFLVFVH